MLAEQIHRDYISAMKAKDAIRISTLSFLRAHLKNLLIDKKTESLDDADVIAVIKKQAKQRQDSIAQYQQGGRDDLVDKETQELEILKSYLPAEMPPEEIKKHIDAAVAEINATGIQDMGKVMKAVLSAIGGQADNKVVSELVKQRLSAI